ncbi:MAG TPA: OsmC family protein [Solimonas sp.]|nr:OsmC family protein [Solimonas sp.]
MVKVSKAADGKLQQRVQVGNNAFIADEPPENGGDDAGPAPHDLLDAALGTCTALTLTLVARRKGYALQDVRVEVSHEKGADGAHLMHRRIELVGELDEEQRQYLLGIANKCPVHKTLSGKIDIDTQLQ